MPRLSNRKRWQRNSCFLLQLKTNKKKMKVILNCSHIFQSSRLSSSSHSLKLSTPPCCTIAPPHLEIPVPMKNITRPWGWGTYLTYLTVRGQRKRRPLCQCVAFRSLKLGENSLKKHNNTLPALMKVTAARGARTLCFTSAFFPSVQLLLPLGLTGHICIIIVSTREKDGGEGYTRKKKSALQSTVSFWHLS